MRLVSPFLLSLLFTTFASGSPEPAGKAPAPPASATAATTSLDVVRTYWQHFANRDGANLALVSPEANTAEILAFAERYRPTGDPRIEAAVPHPTRAGVVMHLTVVPFAGYEYRCAVAVGPDASGRLVVRDGLSIWQIADGQTIQQALKTSARRQDATRAARAEAARLGADYPDTPESLIRAFWKAASRKDYARMQVLSPGSLAEDFKSYYDQWTPSPALAVAPAERHPTAPGVTVYPTQVPFPGFPNKTLKMAVRQDPATKLWVIDAQNTIWW